MQSREDIKSKANDIRVCEVTLTYRNSISQQRLRHRKGRYHASSLDVSFKQVTLMKQTIISRRVGHSNEDSSAQMQQQQQYMKVIIIDVMQEQEKKRSPPIENIHVVSLHEHKREVTIMLFMIMMLMMDVQAKNNRSISVDVEKYSIHQSISIISQRRQVRILNQYVLFIITLAIYSQS